MNRRQGVDAQGVLSGHPLHAFPRPSKRPTRIRVASSIPTPSSTFMYPTISQISRSHTIRLSSSFSTRFATELPTTESDVQQQGPEGAQTSVTYQKARKKWIPWSPVPSTRATPLHVKGTRKKTEDGEDAGLQGKGKAPSPKPGLHVKHAKIQGGRRASQKHAIVVTTRDEEGQNKDLEVNEKQAIHAESSKSTQFHEGRSSQDHLRTPCEDTAAVNPRHLRFLIFDSSSDLMGEAWDAYQRLLARESDEESDPQRDDSFVDSKLLRRLAGRLVKERKFRRKNSRELFLRLLSVYARLRRERERVKGVPYLRTIEWNCLIHFAGTGLRSKATLEAYNASLDVYDDMLRDMDEAKAAGHDSLLCEIRPDIYTYTTLLNIAFRSRHQPAIDYAMSLLQNSRERPTFITYLCMMRYRHRREGLNGAREILSTLHPDDVRCDGINAFLDCAGSDGELSIIRNIYAALRRNVEAYDDGTYGPPDFSKSAGRQAKGPTAPSLKDHEEEYVSVEGIRFSRTLVPSEAIYNYVVQILAYYGRLSESLQVFTDMLATRRPPPEEGFLQPTYEVYRGLFLGFARHGYRNDTSLSGRRNLIERNSEWTWERFNVILDAFLDAADTMAPSERMVYWIMVAVRRMTGDEQTLREVWRRLNERWYIRKGGRLKTLDNKYGKPAEVVQEVPMYRTSIDARA